MAQIHFASDNTADGSRDGSSGHPFLDPSELPTSYRMVSGTEYLFRCDTETNFAAAFRSAAATAAPLVIGSWGSGARPIITAYRLIDGSECLECDVDTSGSSAVLTIPPVGGAGSTNLWRVPKTFFGLFAGNVWGNCTDVANVAGAGKIVPSAVREWCGSVAGGVTDSYGVVYSEGNPVDVYGELYASSFDEATFASHISEQCAFSTLRALGGFEISGLDMRLMNRKALCYVASTTDIYDMARHSFNDIRSANVYRGITVDGALDTYAPGIVYSSLRVYGNYAENLGSNFFDTSGNEGIVLNDARLYHNVVNGFARAYSAGGIYLPEVRTSDGSRILVEENTLCNGDGGHYWPADGYAFYQEHDASDVEFRRNVAWGCKLSFIANRGTSNIVFSNNVAFASDDVEPTADGAYHSFITVNSSSPAGHSVRISGNVAVGFVRFMSHTSSATSHVDVLGNISLGSGAISGSGSGANYEAIRADTADTARINIDGNNFYNHYADLRNSGTGTTYNAPPEVNNRITSDPSAELARLPVPTDPTVNYALQIRPGARIVGGVVDLRPGTRVAA